MKGVFGFLVMGAASCIGSASAYGVPASQVWTRSQTTALAGGDEEMLIASGETNGLVSIYTVAGNPVTTTLTPSTDAVGSNFGASVALDGMVAVVGAPNDNTNAADAGRVHLFTPADEDDVNGEWIPQLILDASTISEGALFGCSVAISGYNVAIGACGEHDGAGNVYVYNIESGTMQALGNYGHIFGNTLAMDGTTLAVGSVTGNVRFFELQDDGTWALTSTIKCGTCRDNERIGDSIALKGSLGVIGVRTTDDGEGFGRGGALVISKDESDATWTIDDFIRPGGTRRNEGFGTSVGIFLPGNILIGAPNATLAVNSTQAAESDQAVGIVYHYIKRRNWELYETITETNPTENSRFGYDLTISEAGFAYIVGNSTHSVYHYPIPQ